MQREYMPITITTAHRLPGEALAGRVRRFGYNVRLNIVAECSRHAFRVGTGLHGEIEEIGIVREAIAPFACAQIAFDPSVDEIGMAIELGSALPPIQDAIELHCPASRQEAALRQATCHGLSVTHQCDEDVREPVLRFREGDPFLTALLGWQLGMPPETRLIHDATIPCAAIAAMPSDARLARLRRQREPVTIRCSDAAIAQAYAEHLQRLGYRIRYRFVMEEMRHTTFGVILGCYHTRTVELPSFQHELQDLLQTTTEWMRQHGVESDAYPFEIKDRNRCFQPMDMESIVIDLPWREWRQGMLAPYGKGHAGRYLCTIQATSREAAASLADKLEERLRIDRPEEHVHEEETRMELVFGRRIMNDPLAQRAYGAALAEALGMSMEEVPVRYNLSNAIDVMIHLPAGKPRPPEKVAA